MNYLLSWESVIGALVETTSQAMRVFLTDISI